MIHKYMIILLGLSYNCSTIYRPNRVAVEVHFIMKVNAFIENYLTSRGGGVWLVEFQLHSGRKQVQ